MSWLNKLKNKVSGSKPKKQAAGQLAYFTALFSMLAKIAKADGVVSKEELSAVETYMTHTLQLRGTNRMLAIKIFRKAKDSTERFEEFAEQYAALFVHDRKTLERTVDLLLAIASAEPRGTERKYALIRKAVKLFGLEPAQYERLRSRYPHSHHAGSTKERTGKRQRVTLNGARLKGASKRASFHCADPHLVLGCKVGDSPEILRSAYRRLARKYHPDTIAAQGLPPEFKRFAERKFREIQSAYEQLSIGSESRD